MMILYSGTSCPFSHRCRFVLHRKEMDFDIKDVDVYEKPSITINGSTYNQVPLLEERNLVLYDSNIINEYIDERFPHPQLMPADPMMRAQARMIIFNFERELFSHVKVLENEENQNPADIENARNAIKTGLEAISPMFVNGKFILGDELTMVDVALAPLLWRLQHYNIKLSDTASVLSKYSERVFAEESFIASLTAAEKFMRK